MTPRSMRILAAAAALALLAAACGGGDKDKGGAFDFVKGKGPAAARDGGGSGAGSTPALPSLPGKSAAPGVPSFPGAGARAATGGGGGACETKLTGDLQGVFKGTGGSGAAGTDYWMTDDEIRQALRALASIGGKSGADLDKEVDQQMKTDPRIYLLILNCEGTSGKDEVSVSFMPANGSRYKDVPFGPKNYEIAAGGLLGGDAKPGQFTVLFSAGDGVYRIPEPGELKITKFDKSGIAGSYRFKAEEMFASGTPRKITVEGTFDYPCSGGGACKR